MFPRRLLPLGFGRQAFAGPGGDGLGLVERDVLDRRRRRPGTRPVLPVLLRLEPAPAVLAPERSLAVAALLDKPAEALVRDRVALDPEGGQLDDVSRSLVVVGPGLVAAQRERAGRDEHVPRRRR